MKTKAKGITLIELLITISVLAIALAVGIPNYQSLVESNRLAASSNDVLSTISLARSEAIKRGETVAIVAIGNDWDNGWQLKLSPFDNTATTLRQLSSTSGIEMSGPASISFNSRGFLTTQPANGIELTSVVGSEARCITFEVTGRPRLDHGGCS